MIATKGTCRHCGVAVERDSYGPPAWIDPDTQDSGNEGAVCPETGSEHEVVSDPDCSSCGDRQMGCSRCTDPDGDKR